MSPTETPVTLAVDAMGGDNGPKEVLDGLASAIENFSVGVEYVLVGDERKLNPLVRKHPCLSQGPISKHHSSE